MKDGYKKILKEDLVKYINENGEMFENKLFTEAINVSVKFQDILRMGNIDLLKNSF